MFGTIHQHLKQYLIQNFSTHSRREGTVSMIVLQCTKLHFSWTTIHHFHSMSNTFTIGNLFSNIAFLIEHGKIHVKNTEKPTFHSKRCFHFTNISLLIPHYFVEIWTPLSNFKDYFLFGCDIVVCIVKSGALLTARAWLSDRAWRSTGEIRNSFWGSISISFLNPMRTPRNNYEVMYIRSSQPLHGENNDW